MLIMKAMLSSNLLISGILWIGIFITTALIIWLLNRVLFGTVSNHLTSFNDVGIKEFFISIALFMPIIYLGIFPNILLDYIYWM